MTRDGVDTAPPVQRHGGGALDRARDAARTRATLSADRSSGAGCARPRIVRHISLVVCSPKRMSNGWPLLVSVSRRCRNGLANVLFQVHLMSTISPAAIGGS